MMTSIPTEDAIRSRAAKPWALGSAPWQRIAPTGSARIRVIVDNDFSGDPDDLYQLVHHLLSPTVEIRAVIGSHLRDGDAFDASSETAGNAVCVARDVFARMGVANVELICRGSDRPLVDLRSPQPSEAAEVIVAEALRDDDRPLYFVAGGGLTDLASALLTEPGIAARMTLIWIGGNEHPDLAVPPPDAMPIEYNLLIDVNAARVVFGRSEIPIWQVPRDVYRQCLVSDAELRMRVASRGELGRYLYDELAAVGRRAREHGRHLGETYALGDSPLVLLSALQSAFEPDPASSRYVMMPTPGIDEDGRYTPTADAREMRAYTWVDTRLMFEDFYLKLEEFCRWQSS